MGHLLFRGACTRNNGGDARCRRWNGSSGTDVMSFEQIIYEKHGHVATITLNRPAKLNAYSETMVHEILAALADSRDDDTIRVVILTGTGRGFCSGGDI